MFQSLNRCRVALRKTHRMSVRDASSLIIAQHKGGSYDPSLLPTVTAAIKVGGPVSVLVAGKDIGNVAKSVSEIVGVDKVITAEDASLEHSIAENVTSVVSQLQSEHSFSHIFAAATNEGKNIIPRVSAVLDGAAISEILEVVNETTFKRPMYAGSAIATVSSSHSPKAITVRTTNFDKAAASGNSAEVSAHAYTATESKTVFKEEMVEKSDRPEITAADVVVAGGRALKSADNFKILYSFADAFPKGAAVGASRAAVDAGYAANDLQIGQTGKVCAPDLYFAVGISGAIQHLAGMKDSKCIVAINTDKEAPIFQVSDYGLEADLFKAVPELEQKLKA